MIGRRAVVTHSGAVILAAVAVLFGMGLLCIYATDAGKSGIPVHTAKQSAYLGVSVGLSWLVLRVGYQWFARYGYAIFLFGVALLIPLALARYIPMGGLIPSRRNVHRWISLPFFQFQPSEFMKVAFIVGLAGYLRFRRNYRTFGGFLIPIAAAMVPIGLILVEPNLGTALLLLPVLLFMLYAAGARLRHFALVALAGLAACPLVWWRMSGYQRERLVGLALQSDALRQAIITHPQRYAFLATPEQARRWETDLGMQLGRSKAALGSGGVTGQGWGRGTYIQYNFLPDRHNDFVFALVGHQWGLAGCLLVLICYALIVTAGLEIAAGTQDPFGRLVAVGVVALLASQAGINMGMTMGLLPITGMTLPFVSYGGSSLLANALAVALLMSVSRYKPFWLAHRAFEFGRARQPESPVRPALIRPSRDREGAVQTGDSRSSSRGSEGPVR